MSILVTSTVQAPRRRTEISKPRAPIPAQQKKEKAAQCQETQDAINEAVDEWFLYTNAKAIELAERFDKKPRYFLDLFFHGGARMVHQHTKVNPYNAFISLKAQELREDGNAMNMISIQSDLQQEYKNLDEESREELVQEYLEIKVNTHSKRVAPRGCVQDFANTVRNIESLINSLKMRVGIEGFFCLVRNTLSYHIRPQWFFTSKALEEYMKIATKSWDLHTVGTRIEAFAIAGCDPVNLLTSSKKKAEHYKTQIRELIGSKLREITGNPNAVMQYSRYEEHIVMHYGVVLEGWPYEKMINPSSLSTSLPPLKILYQALVDGDCKFVKLTNEQKKEREAAYLAKIAKGEEVLRKRKKRSDAGIRRANKRVRSNEEVSSEEEGSDDNGAIAQG